MSDNNISVIEQYLGKYPWFSEGYLDLYKAMCSLEGDVGLTYLNKAASHVWSRSKLYEIYKESLIEQADVVDSPAVVAEILAEVAEAPAVVEEIHPAIVVETSAVLIDSPPVVIETPAVVEEIHPAIVVEAPAVVVDTPTVVAESPAVVEETRVPEEEDEPVSEKPAEPKLERVAVKIEERAAKPANAPTYREYELIQLDEEEDLGRDIVFEDNSFVITENKPKFVLAGGDYFTKKDFEMIELDLTQPLDHFIAEKPTLLRSAIIGKGSKPVVINDTESAESLDDEAFYTETLASIYIEQGFYKRALDVYAKLILLFPEKSSYFATLVKDIKNKYNT
ncbi:MAG: hypothetical protein CVU13_07510 [Bacteroidetes bacterium HGW-Bacteroidetes-8]|jgi:hypothetical protein|nr:MAG: hypothetical protein CVU13_07510 [Bacteroidetes bacterium HGW-Bacteroidetes-8]